MRRGGGEEEEDIQRRSSACAQQPPPPRHRRTCRREGSEAVPATAWGLGVRVPKVGVRVQKVRGLHSSFFGST